MCQIEGSEMVDLAVGSHHVDFINPTDVDAGVWTLMGSPV
jgi:hypothetical protein